MSNLCIGSRERRFGGPCWRTRAHDARAEAFAQALAREHTIRDPSAWIWNVSFRIARGELKNRSFSPSIAAPVESSYEMPQPVADLVAALQTISPKQRAAIILHDYADRPTREVAKVLGSSVATVHVHLSQGRRRLRTILREAR